MAYLEIRKNGELVKRQQIDDTKAQKGCKMSLGAAGAILLKTGETKTVGKYELKIIAGIAEQAKNIAPEPNLEPPATQPEDNIPQNKQGKKRNRLLLVSVTAVVLLAIVGAGLFAYYKLQRRSEDEKTVRQLAGKFVSSFIAEDTNLLEESIQLLTDNFTGTMSDGTVLQGKSQAADYFRKSVEYARSNVGNPKVTYQIKSIKMTNDSATILGKVTVSGQTKENSQSFSADILETLAFQKINNNWQLVMEHSTGVNGVPPAEQVKQQLAAEQTKNDKFPLHTAVFKGDIEKVKELIAKGYNVNTRDEGDSIALHYAVHIGHKEIAELLIASGADINAKNKNGGIPIMLAALSNRNDIVEMLIAKGAEKTIYVAAAQGDVEAVKALLKKDPNLVNAPASNDGMSALHWAAFMDRLDVVKALIENGANVNICSTPYDVTPLFWAVRKDHLDAAKLLIEKGADVKIKMKNGGTILHSPGTFETAKLLIDNGADVNAKDNNGITPLHSIANKGNLSAVQRVLFDKSGGTAATWNTDFEKHRDAAEKVTVEIAELLIKNGADINAKDEKGDTPLSSAKAAKNKALVEFLEKYNASGTSSVQPAEQVKQPAAGQTENKEDRFPLRSAVAKGDVEKVKELIAKGYNINTQDDANWTPLHNSAQAGRKEIAELLMASGADVNAKNKDGWTALMFATVGGYTEIVKSLLEKGADVNAKNNDGWTALMFVMEKGYIEIVKSLLEKGADVNAKNKDGWTALTFATVKGHSEIAKLLLDKGADVNAKNERGDTPLSIAKAANNQTLIELLEKYNAKDKTD
jgi:ankyrin repeat protein